MWVLTMYLYVCVQVVVLQEYRNDSFAAIEAKFVFPLDEMSVVCGFEAYINGKHVVGVVKEKEIAHREYRQAVEAGHGAYLMDQQKEQPVSLPLLFLCLKPLLYNLRTIGQVLISLYYAF